MSLLKAPRRGDSTRARPIGLLPWLLASCFIAAAPAKAEMAVASLDFDLAEPLRSEAIVSFDEPVPAPGADPASAEAIPPLLTLSAIQSDLAVDESESLRIADGDERLSFGEHFNSVKVEMAGAFAYMTAVNLLKFAARDNLRSFRLKDEGFFGRDTDVLGVDKLTHAHNTYILSELIGARIRKKTGTTRGTAMSGALMATGLMLYSEVYDGFKGGFGFEDLLFNSLGAGFSVLRSTTPGLEEKLDFRVLIIPNRQIYSFTGEEHYRQLRYLFALELGGFEQFRESPLRFVELHAGYYGKGFTDDEVARGEPLERKLFVGVGLNLNELLFKRSPRTRTARVASEVLNYWQPPYTYVHVK